MSDKNLFQNAIAKSKAFVSELKDGKGKGKSQPDGADGEDAGKASTERDDTEVSSRVNKSYDRRFRIITDAERREYPLDLGEDGWADRSWSNAQQQYALEVKQENERKAKAEKARRKLELQKRKGKVLQDLDEKIEEWKSLDEELGEMTPGTPNSQEPSPYMRVSENLARTFNRQATMATPPRDPSWFRQPSGTTDIAARRLGVPSGESPLRVRTQHPAPSASPVKQPRYNRKGAKIGSGDWGRDTYLAKQGFKIKGKETQQHEETEESTDDEQKKDQEEAKKDGDKEDVPGSAVSRWGDGIKKASGPTLW